MNTNIAYTNNRTPILNSNYNNQILLISYNEGEQDFYDSELNEIQEKIIESKSKIIIISTQKSKSQVAIAIPGKKMFTRSNSTKHFPHVLGQFLLEKGYKLVYKKDASFMVRAVTENNNVRTRIYQIGDSNSNLISNLKDKLSHTTLGKVTTSSVNRQAIYVECIINGRKCIFINTELATYDNGNLGKSDRQREFMDLIVEFELNKKLIDGYNIIFSGSLNFRLNPLTLFNKESRNFVYNTLKKNIINNTKKDELIKMNELKKYINNIIKILEEEKNKKEKVISRYHIVTEERAREIIKINESYETLLTKFSKSIEEIGIQLNCDYDLNSKSYDVHSILKLGTVAKKINTAYYNAHTQYKKSNTTSNTGSIISKLSGIVKTPGLLVKGAFYDGLGSLGSQSFNHLNKSFTKSKKYGLPSMCDKVLFAFPDNTENILSYKSFNVLYGLKKSRNRIVVAEFKF